jgi:hypothetical protein
MLRSFFIISEKRGLPRKVIFKKSSPEFPTGEADMKSVKLVQIAGLLAVTAMLVGGAGAAFAQTVGTATQTAPAPSSMKTIGAPSAAAKPEIVPSLIVLNSRGATLQGDTLTLTGVTPNSILFADRPVRAAGHVLTAHLIEDWGASTPGNDSFVKDPPNATVSVFSKDGSVKDAVVVLKNPKLDGDKLTFNVQTLEGDLTGGDGAASIFIDIFGVWRRAAYRGAMYAGAAAAVGAAAYAAPYAYRYAHPACGYYPYPPCY